jgi:hypothetical protein
MNSGSKATVNAGALGKPYMRVELSRSAIFAAIGESRRIPSRGGIAARGTVLSTAIILAMMLISAGHVAFAQKDAANRPRPTAAVSPEWERIREALKKAKPMPNPKHALRSNALTEHGDLRAFDPKTAAVVNVPAAGPRPTMGVQHIEGKPAVLPTNLNGGNLNPRKSNASEGTSQAQALAPNGAIPPPSTTPTPPGALLFPYGFPYNTYARLLMRFNDGISDYYYLCSASTASDFHIVSAGHCIYNHDIRNDGSNIAGWAAEVWAWAAQTDVVDPVDWSSSGSWPDFPYGVAKMTWEVTYNSWINSSDLNWDFSFITLDRRLGDHTGWIGREWGTSTTSLNFSGYPAQIPYVPAGNPFQYPGFDANNVIGYTCCRIQLDAYTYGGHSGGPVWRYDGTNRYLEGVNSTSDRAGYAEATLLTSQIATDLDNQINGDKTTRPPNDLAQVIEYVFNGSSKGLGQTSTEIGFAFPFTLNAFNAGYIDAGDTTADIYLTLDPNNVTGGTYIGTHDFGYLTTNSYAVQTSNISIPTYVVPGTYYVGYVLKAANLQYGTDKNSVVVEAQQMNAYCNSDAYEYDNSSGFASQLTSGSVQNHSLCAQADQDWAKFTVSSFPSAVSLATEGYSGGDTTITLYDANLNQIDFNDDNGVNYYSIINRSCNVNALAPGTYYVLIQSYRNGTIIPNYTLSLSTSPCPLTTSTSVVSSPNPSVYSHNVIFTATVTAGTGTPSGLVNFYNGASLMGSASLIGGKASITRSSLTAGAHSIKASYAGHSPWLASSSSALTQIVNKAATSTTEVSSANPSPFGKNITFTVHVTSTAGVPSGTVTFKDGATILGTRTLSAGIAKLSTATLSVGLHSITAAYGGSGNFKTSASTTLTEQITKAGSSASVTSSLNPSKHGQSVTFTATVKSSTSGTPSGSVTFKNGSTVLGTRTLSGGKATLATSALAVGSHSMTVVYGGDVHFNGSTSPILTQTVNP